MNICVYSYFHSQFPFVQFVCKDFSLTRVMNMNCEIVSKDRLIYKYSEAAYSY